VTGCVWVCVREKGTKGERERANKADTEAIGAAGKSYESGRVGELGRECESASA